MNSVYKLLIQLVGQDKGATRELKKTKRGVKELDSQLKGLKNTMQLAGFAGIAFMGKQAISAAWDLGKLGAESLRMEASFGKLAQRIGTSGDALLKSLKETSSGTVTELDLMRTTAGLLASGIQTNTRDITDAMEIARLKAQQFGITTTEAYERMVTGARKFSVEMLDELGITLKAESVYKRKADALGTVASALTDAQKASSLWEAILEDGRQELEEYGGAVDDMATDMERAEVAISDLKTEIAEGFAPAIAEAATGVTKFLSETALGFTLLGAALDGTIGPLDYFTIGMDAQRIANEKGSAAAVDYVARLLEVRVALEGVETEQEGWMVSLGKLPGYLAQTDTALEGHIGTLHATAQAYLMLSDETKKWKAELTAADISGMDPYETVEGQLAAQDALDQQKEDNAQKDIDRAEANQRAWETAIDAQKRKYDELRSAVESALTPTVVTDLDMSLTELGQYVDKWDENARRLDAVAEGGFAALEAHPDWVEILKIPDEVLAGSEAGLKAWSAQVGASVRDLTRPDLLNIDAAVAAVEQYFADMAARELSIDLVTQAMIEKGVVSGPDAKKQVAQALGLDQTGIGETAGADIFQGMIDKFSEKSAAGEFATYLSKDVITQAGALRGAGYELWLTTEVGILNAMEEGNYILKWIELLLPHLVAALGTQGQWAGEGEP